MDECLLRGHSVFVCEPHDMLLRDNQPWADVQRVTGTNRDVAPALTLAEGSERFPLSHFHAVLMRKDPPFDATYLQATQILEYARGQTFLMNDPRGLREANEKLYIFRFPDLIATTIVTRKMDEIRAFMAQIGGDIVVKPVDGFGGSAVFHVRPGDSNVSAILEVSTQGGRRWVMAQRYLPEGKKGDKRIHLLGGEPVGWLWRTPAGDDIRSNLAAGGTAHATQLTDRDRQICARLRPHLIADGLHFVGIDVIGDYMLEVNVTSPTGVQAVSRLYNFRLEGKLVDYIEAHAPRMP
jgi:glutathione synthase